ncbi:hypothetical protein KSP40_PGU009262 [Platanthera guangdongensis]|uniref:Remorin N-terminal domain-containing protein n=1 Tax=Platanthera guangdongensis TaxID=2320717 RepID=A0ABR2LW46_9ASPA
MLEERAATPPETEEKVDDNKALAIVESQFFLSLRARTMRDGEKLGLSGPPPWTASWLPFSSLDDGKVFKHAEVGVRVCVFHSSGAISFLVHSDQPPRSLEKKLKPGPRLAADVQPTIIPPLLSSTGCP